MIRFFMFSFFAAASAFAHYDDCNLTLSPNVEIDRMVQTTSTTVGLSTEDLLKMIRDNFVMAMQTDHPSRVVGQLYARSPKDHLVYEIDFVHDADFQIQRLVEFSLAREPIFSRYDFIKMEEIQRKREMDAFNREVESVRGAMDDEDAAEPAPRRSSANDNFAFRVTNRHSIFSGARVDLDFAARGERLEMVKEALANASSVGLPWTPSAAFDVNLPFDLTDRGVKTYLISPTSKGHIFVLLRSERGVLICEDVGLAEPEEHRDFLCRVDAPAK